MSREYYNKFEMETVTPALTEFQHGIINDKSIRLMFLKHTQMILEHYSDSNQRIGRLAQYIEADKIANHFLNKKKKSFIGYFSLLPIVNDYIYHKIRGRHYEFSGELGESIALAKKYDPSIKGKQHLLQVTCDAERDFLLLINCYIDFFIFSGKCKAQYDSQAIHLGLKVPGLHYIIKKKLTKYNNYVDVYEEQQANSSTAYIINGVAIQNKLADKEDRFECQLQFVDYYPQPITTNDKNAEAPDGNKSKHKMTNKW